jgi:RNA polymerase sigma factor (sigma-70 family)
MNGKAAAAVKDQTTDHERMAAVARGDLPYMGEIYENRHRSLFRFFFRLTGRQALSEDLVHEVFLRMIRYRHTYQGTGVTGAEGFESWMYRIARNAFADHGRKHRREVTPETAEFDEIESANPTPFETAAKRQDLALLHRALRELPQDKRELLVLTRFQELSHDQIGRILGCEAGTVKGRVFRAMKELGQIYQELRKEKAS